HADKLACSLGFMLGLFELLKKGLFNRCCVRPCELLNQTITSSFVRSLSDFFTTTCKKLLLLQLNTLPRWIPKPHVKPTTRKHLREGQIPVEKTVAPGQWPDSLNEARPLGESLRETVQVFS